MKSLLIFTILIAPYITADEDFLPSYIHPCKINEPDFESCVKEQIQASLPYFTKGIPEYGVNSIDPTNLDDIVIDGNGLKLTFSKAQMHGLSDAKLTELKIIVGSKNDSFKLGVKTNLSLTAQYNADGKILILPIKGDGKALIQCDNIEVQINSVLNHVKDSKGTTHFKLVSPKYEYDIQTTKIDLENLFNGNKQLAETTLKFVNENWRQLMDDLAPPVIKQIVKTIIKTINKFFSKVTIERIIEGFNEKSETTSRK